MHTMWKGTISFGLVNIPVKMHAATENKDIKLRNLHKDCKTPIQYKKVCPTCDREVNNDEIVKAYEYAKNKFVVLDDDELAELRKEQTSKAVEIMDFVDLEEIDPIYFEKSYFLSPGDGGAKSYGLLRSALEDTGKIGVAKIMIRSKERLAVIRIYQNTLVVETIHYPDEVRAVEDVPNVPAETNNDDKELETAKMLVEQLSAEFNPDKYHDEYRESLMKLIEAKKEGEDVTTAEEQSKPDNVTNLMDALEKSLERAEKDDQSKTAPQEKRKIAK